VKFKRIYKRIDIIKILIGIFFAIVYLSFPTRMHFGDGLYYAFHIEKMPVNQAFHPHHLLWLPIMHYLYSAFHYIFPFLRAMVFLQAFNALCGGLSVFLMIRIVSSITKNQIAGIIAGLALGLSWGMLHYATDANVYVPVLTLALFNFALITGSRQLDYGKSPFATIIMVLISSLHQIGFFFSFAILAAIIIRSSKYQRIKVAIQCAIIYVALNIILYGSVFMAIINTISNPFQKNPFTWITAFGRNRDYWSLFSLGFLGAQKSFDRSQFNLFFHIIDQNKAFYEGGYHESAFILILYGLVQFIVLVTMLCELFCLIRRKNIKWRETRIILLTWFIPFYIFNQFFCAFDVGYKLLYLAPLIMIWTFQLLGSSTRFVLIIKKAIPVILIGLAIWNFADGAIPDTKPENNPYFRDALEIMPYGDKSDLALFTEKERYTSAVLRCYSKADSVFVRENPFMIPSEAVNVSSINQQTIEFLSSRYKRIIVSDALWNSTMDEWHLPDGHIPPPYPEIMIVKRSELMSNKQWVFSFADLVIRLR